MIGALDQLIAFEEEIRQSDGMGGASLSWSELPVKSWAAVKPVSAREGERQGAMRGGVIYLFTVHRRTDINEAMRIRWGALVLNIREIRLPPARNLTMEIVAEAGVTQ